MPGHPDLAFDAVTLASGGYDVMLVEPARQPLGTVVETVTHHDDGTVTVTADVDIVIGNGGEQSQDTTRYVWPSLAPLSHASVDHNDDGDEVQSLRFDGLHVTGAYQDAGAPAIPVDLELAAPAFGPGSDRKVARALPFEAGYTAVLPTFSAEDRLEAFTFTVVGREDVERPDGSTVSAWIVEQVEEAGRARQYAVDPETRDLLRISFSPAPGYLVHFVRQ